MARQRNLCPAWARASVVLAALAAMAVGLIEAQSARAGEIADVEVGWDGILFAPQVGYERLLLTVSGPGDIYLSRKFSPGAPAFIDPSDEAGNPLPDGAYTYELRVVPLVGPEARETMAAAREAGTGEAAVAALRAQGLLPAGPLVQSGHFAVREGMFVERDALEETAVTDRLDPGGMITNDQVINDDLIVTSSLCVGSDCVNGENFGFDTVRLKENNLRLHFDDTSNTSNYPRNDWRIIANDQTNGGASYLAIEDATAGRIPFRVEAGASANALYVESDGDVGFGTANPVVELHTADGDTPTLRLEQDSTSGWPAQSWDVAGNETNFFVRDVTNGSQIPFKIKPSAPTNSLYIDSDGDVGLGTTSPAASLEVTTSDGTSQILVDENSATVANRTLIQLENNGNPQMQFLNSSSGVNWTVGHGPSNAFIVKKGSKELRFREGGRLNVRNGTVNIFDLKENGNLIIAGTLRESSDRNAKRDIQPLDGSSVLTQVAALPVSSWTYKQDGTGARHAGPMAQDFHAAFGLGPNDTSISPRDVAGVALAAVKELQEVVREKDAQLDRVLRDKNARIAALEARLLALEQRLSKAD